jgi:hypothetical protein
MPGMLKDDLDIQGVPKKSTLYRNDPIEYCYNLNA